MQCNTVFEHQSTQLFKQIPKIEILKHNHFQKHICFSRVESRLPVIGKVKEVNIKANLVDIKEHCLWWKHKTDLAFRYSYGIRTGSKMTDDALTSSSSFTTLAWALLSAWSLISMCLLWSSVVERSAVNSISSFSFSRSVSLSEHTQAHGCKHKHNVFLYKGCY